MAYKSKLRRFVITFFKDQKIQKAETVSFNYVSAKKVVVKKHQIKMKNILSCVNHYDLIPKIK